MVKENIVLKHLLVHSHVVIDDCYALLFYTLMLQRVNGKMWQRDTPLSGWQRPESYGWIQSGGARPSMCSGVRRMAWRMRRSKVRIDWFTDYWFIDLLIDWLLINWLMGFISIVEIRKMFLLCYLFHKFKNHMKWITEVICYVI